MHYKTIVLELIQSRPALHEHLRQKQALPTVLEQYATELKMLHQAWIIELHRTRPGSHPTQLRAEALELALAEMDLPEDFREPFETVSAPHE